ncbi:hypothetical protein [Sphingobacterium faecium]|uniref:hypothetical protein n=1 Tax=Sphingobacterium faecium TaxID=34087 RepID=UPI001D177A79|nr:hypothetical protein [Sphingobacterium faecium]
MVRSRMCLLLLFAGYTLAVWSCQDGKASKANAISEAKTEMLDSLAVKGKSKNTMYPDQKSVLKDTIVVSTKHDPHVVLCDMDGDARMDTVHIVQHTMNHKYGLKIAFGNKKIVYLGMGQDILGQGFDDIEWVGIFEISPKGEIYYNNVNDEGEIITEEQVNENDKIKLPNDGIFIHQAEACGGGIIYLHDGHFAWIQQE